MSAEHVGTAYPATPLLTPGRGNSEVMIRGRGRFTMPNAGVAEVLVALSTANTLPDGSLKPVRLVTLAADLERNEGHVAGQFYKGYKTIRSNNLGIRVVSVPDEGWKIIDSEPEAPTPTIFATRNPENAAITTESTIHYMNAGTSMSWADIPVDVVKGILERAAEETDIPVSMFANRDFRHRYKFLGNRPLNSLYMHVQFSEERRGKNIPGFLMEQLGIEATTSDITTAMGKGRIIAWDTVSEESVRQILAQAAIEADVPVPLLNTKDLTERKYNFLNGHGLSGLYHYSKREAAQQATYIAPLPYLFDKLGITLTEDDIAAAKKAEKNIASNRFTPEATRNLLESAAEELGIPVSLLTAKDLTGTRFGFLGGKTLRPLYEDASQNREEGKPVIVTLLEKTGITLELDDVVLGLQQRRDIPWEQASEGIFREILVQAAEEFGKPPALLINKDLKRTYEFLDGSTLQNLFNYMQSLRGEGKTALGGLLEKAGIEMTTEDLILKIRTGNIVQWQFISKATINELLIMVAEENEKPLGMLSSSDFEKPQTFLNGRNLEGLYDYFANHDERGDGKVMPFMQEHLGIEIKADEVIQVIRKRDGSHISWGQVPEAALRGVIEYIAEELYISPSVIGAVELNSPLECLNGGSLVGLYNQFLYLRRDERGEFETVTAQIKREVGLPDSPKGRKGYRQGQMSQLFLQYFEGQPVDSLTATDLMPWMVDVAKIYKNPSFSIDKEEIQNELFLLITDYLAAGEELNSESLVAHAHRHIEKQVGSTIAKSYKEKSLATPLGDTDLTLGDTLADKSATHTLQEVVFSRETHAALSSLTPLQRALVLGITVHEQTFDELVGEVNSTFGLQTDMDKLEEYYNEALTILQGKMKPEDTQ